MGDPLWFEFHCLKTPQLSLDLLCTLQGSLFRRESFPENAFKRHSLQRTVCHAALCKQKLVSYSEVYVLGNYCPQKEKIIGAFGASGISAKAKLAGMQDLQSVQM